MPILNVKKSILIDAPLDKVFVLVQDFHTWRTWSPWLCVEQEATTKITGRGTEVGDISHWKGEVIGEGEMEHDSIISNKRIEQELRFIHPYKSISTILFEMEEQEGKTKLSWSMKGSLPFFLFFMKKMMEAMLGSDFKRGLMMLKEYAETGEVSSECIIDGVVDIPEVTYVSIRRETSMDEMSEEMSKLFPQLIEELKKQDISPVGLPMSIYHKWDLKKEKVSWSVAIPVNKEDTCKGATLQKYTREAGAAFKVTHVGKYIHLGNAWAAIQMHVRANKLKAKKGVDQYEVYDNDPASTPAGELKTEIFIPLR